MTAPILSAVFANTAKLFRFGFVADVPVSETAPLDPNYITWIRTASSLALAEEAFPSVPNALLYRLLRYAVRTDMWREARKILLSVGLASADDLREHELVGIAPGTESRPTPAMYLAQPVATVTHGLSLGEYLSPIRFGEPFRTLPDPLVALQAALATLEPLPTAELERLTTETLDLASSRADAWITSLYTTRLAAMRARQPTGLYVGGYAWIENVRPEVVSTNLSRNAPTSTFGSSAANALADRPIALTEMRTVPATATATQTAVALNPPPVRVSAGGYIHAPSMTHAAAAAVLRNGFLTTSADAATAGSAAPYAINLTSARVRAAQFVLEAVQNGQAVGAVFGYQVERGLHEALAESLIEPLRTLYPIVANKAFDSGLTADVVAARNVVDGLQLRTAWRAGTIPWGASGLPAAGALRTALETVLTALDDTVDAVSDLLLAESVYQIVRGSTDGASATLDALAQGVRPPDPGIAHALRGGTDLTHRVAIVLGGPPVALPVGWSATLSPRAAAEPRLDAWVGTLLGTPTNVRCRVSVPGGATTEISLDQLQLRPLDLLALAAAVRDAGQVSELDRRIVYAALGDAPLSSGPPMVDYTRASTWDRLTVRTVPEWLVLADSVTTLISAARVLEPQDLVRPADAASATGVGLAVGDAEGRATAATTALAAAISPLTAAVGAVPANTAPTPAQSTALRAALRTAAGFGVPGSYPVPGAGVSAGGVDTTLLAQATSVLATLTQRQAAATAAVLPAVPAPTDAQRVAAAAAIAGAVLGRDFVFLAGCTPPPAATMTAALLASAALVGDADAPLQWAQQVARVRTPLARWRQTRLLAAASGMLPAPLDVVQLPVAAGARWGALPFLSDADRVASRLSLVLERPSAPAATDVWYGLVVDEWVELIPNPTESTGLALHYDDPGAEAAQAVLIAVPPLPDARQWDIDTVIDTLNETFDLAKLRAVDLSLLGELGQLLPAIFFAANNNDDTITIKWESAMRTEATMSPVIAADLVKT
jgi:hypothetical protein